MRAKWRLLEMGAAGVGIATDLVILLTAAHVKPPWTVKYMRWHLNTVANDRRKS